MEGASHHHPALETSQPVVSESLARLLETAEDYARVVAILNPRWRVIECRDSVQWILQRRAKAEPHPRPWEGRSYCRTSEALIRCAREHAGEINPEACAILAALPSRLEAI
jgi:hypothetical protein